LVLLQVWLDVETSAVCIALLWFGRTSFNFALSCYLQQNVFKQQLFGAGQTMKRPTNLLTLVKSKLLYASVAQCQISSAFVYLPKLHWRRPYRLSVLIYWRNPFNRYLVASVCKRLFQYTHFELQNIVN